MKCESVNVVLAKKGLQPPVLFALSPDNQNYNGLLLQPSWSIYAGDDRIGAYDQTIATQKCSSFLKLAVATEADIAIAPEYCVPWSVLQKAVESEAFPTPGRLWVLGCESITGAELEAFATAVQAIVIHEPVPPHGTYLDPVALCFQTQTDSGDWTRVVLIQFKTAPSRDDHFLENEHLIRGTTIYRFQSPDELLSLGVIICSDAFALATAAGVLRRLTDRATLIHIQLNPNPRHPDYRAYRTLTFRGNKELTNCDIVCLNWAKNVKQYDQGGAEPTDWKNIGGSAWYLPHGRCSTSDVEILRNHKKGLYYCFMEERRHALLFHYDEAVFKLSISKPVADVDSVLVNSLGPLMVARYRWDAEAEVWSEDVECPETGLATILEEDEDVAFALRNVHGAGDDLAVERVVSLAAGRSRHQERWFKLDLLEACRLDADEIVRRVTFAADSHPRASEYRNTAIQRTAALGKIIEHHVDWPPQVRDIKGASLSWVANDPNYNLRRDNMEPALVVYLGEHPEGKTVRAAADGLYELLRKEGRTYSHRIAICFRRHGQLVFAQIPALTRFDMVDNGLADISRVIEPSEQD
ncbi:hypothetical protein MKD38_06230 [Cupriavidus sp. WGlv3]|uniref:hypothetical protein n=1 Tax=Cupriavidus sp. WGlv3 TaxID=2919924 RepID=UPI0020911911|nr:hypothetical protein [Cupriavidus sp. WGlv3]MCO4861259.1 hypothetical protein [Cupriavidus sp. WGlv3]